MPQASRRLHHGLPAAQRQLISQCRLGATLHVQGRLGCYREQRQVTVELCWLETDPLAEAMHWARARALWHECYSISFRVPSQALRHQERDNSDVQGAAAVAPQPQHTALQSAASGSPPSSRPSQQQRKHVRDIFVAEAQRRDGAALTARSGWAPCLSRSRTIASRPSWAAR